MTGDEIIWPTQSLQTPQMHSVQTNEFLRSHGRPQLAQKISSISDLLPKLDDCE
jgi:hypothetical protein